MNIKRPLILTVMAMAVGACTLVDGKYGDLPALATDYVNEYYPNEFDYYDDFLGEGFRKTTRFRHKDDPNFILVLQGGEVQNCVDYPDKCKGTVARKYDHSKEVANRIRAVNETLGACQIPILEVLISSLIEDMPTFVVETSINNTALARLHQCLMPAYPSGGEPYYQSIRLHMIAPSGVPSPVRVAGIFDKRHPKTKTDPVYVAHFGKSKAITLDNIKLSLHAPFTDKTKKAMINEARQYLDKTKQGYMTGKEQFDPHTSDLVFNPVNADEYHLYIQACSQPYKPKKASESPCQDSVVSLKYNTKTGKFYDHKWISTPNKNINMLFDLPKVF